MQSKSQDNLSRFLASPSADTWEALESTGFPSIYESSSVLDDILDSSSLETAQNILVKLRVEDIDEGKKADRLIFISALKNLIASRLKYLGVVLQSEAKPQIEAEHSSEPQPEL